MASVGQWLVRPSQAGVCSANEAYDRGHIGDWSAAGQGVPGTYGQRRGWEHVGDKGKGCSLGQQGATEKPELHLQFHIPAWE